mmetsp:Transcript_30224/g.88385  ORF Transcript_30224/g.88385 Transcript_30224/m.88385 type:complete len:335 (-) Transcript_30224:513-1517(-)
MNEWPFNYLDLFLGLLHNLGPVLTQATSLHASLVIGLTEIRRVQRAQTLSCHVLTPTRSRLTRLGNCHIIVRAPDGLRTNLILVSVTLLREDSVARTRSLDGGILVEERRGINSVVKQSLFDILLALELLPLPDELAVTLTLLLAGISRSAAGVVLLAKGSVGGEVDLEGLEVTEGHDRLRRLGALLQLLLISLVGVLAYLLLENLLSLSLGKHPEVVGGTLHQRSRHLVGIHLGSRGHLLLGHVHPPLAALLATLELPGDRRRALAVADGSNTAVAGKTVGNPRHIKRILADLPRRGVEEVAVHAPLGNLVVLLAHVRNPKERGDEEGAGGLV